MKQFSILGRLMLLCIACSLSIPSHSQGVAIYKKDGTMVKYAYEENSIVTYNYGEEPGTPTVPDTPVTPPVETEHQAIDLGLPSGIKWATMNVGATSPEDYGGYYAWGETEEKDNYEWSTYKWCNGSENTMTKYCTDSSYGTVDSKTALDLEDDVAHVKWGGSWRMPTSDELKELYKNCTWTWTTQNGVNGYKVTGSNGNSIFLPAAGYRYGTGVYYRGSDGSCWSSSLYSNLSYSAYYLYFDSGHFDWYYGYRYYGHSVRPVSK